MIFLKPLFPSGLPKIHEHDGKRPQAFRILLIQVGFDCTLLNVI
jgi:hypothetical protein